MERRRTIGLGVLLLCVLGASSVVTGSVAAQPAEQGEQDGFDTEAVAAIERHIESIGGEEAIKAMTSRRLRGVVTLTVPSQEQTRKGTALIVQAAPNKVHQSVIFPGYSEQVDYYDGEIGWEQQIGQKPVRLEGEREAALARNAGFFLWYGVGYQERYRTIEYRGVRDIRGESIEYVYAVRKDGLIDILLFNPNTGRLAGYGEGGTEDAPAQQPMFSWILDYTEVNGVQIPSRFRQDGPGYYFVIEYQRIDLNVDVESVFRRPESIDAG